MAKKLSGMTNIYVDIETRNRLKKLAKKEERNMMVMIKLILNFYEANKDA